MVRRRKEQFQNLGKVAEEKWYGILCIQVQVYVERERRREGMRGKERKKGRETTQQSLRDTYRVDQDFRANKLLRDLKYKFSALLDSASS